MDNSLTYNPILNMSDLSEKDRDDLFHNTINVIIKSDFSS